MHFNFILYELWGFWWNVNLSNLTGTLGLRRLMYSIDECVHRRVSLHTNSAFKFKRVKRFLMKWNVNLLFFFPPFSSSRWVISLVSQEFSCTLVTYNWYLIQWDNINKISYRKLTINVKWMCCFNSQINFTTFNFINFIFRIFRI